MEYKPIQYGGSLEPTKVPTNLDVAFFAGFYDGEGSVNRRRGYAALCVHVSQKDPELLYKARDFWGGSVRFIAIRGKKASPTFEDYESWKNPLFRWQISGDRARLFLKAIYPFLSQRRKEVIDTMPLELTHRQSRVSPKMSPERIEKRAQMDAHEKYLESKAFFRANNLERLRAEDREFKRGKYVPKNSKPVTEIVQ
jgi:hypothetical protein